MRRFLLHVWVLLAIGTLLCGELTLESELYTELPSPAFEVDYRRTDLNRSTRPKGRLYEGSIIDAHVHLHPPKNGIDVSALAGVINALEAAGVEFAVFMPTPNEGRNKTMKRALLRERYFWRRTKTGSVFLQAPII